MSGTGGFQTQVNDQPAVAVAGDFASQNPWFTYNAGPGGLVAGVSGLTIGHFAWTAPPVDTNDANTIANSFGSGPVAGFVGNQLEGLNTTFLSYAGMTIKPGYQCTLYTGTDFWVKNDGSTEALVGQKAYANFADGSVSFAATGTPTVGASATGSDIAAATFSVTGSIANNILTVTAVGSGTVVAGGTLSGSGVASGTKVLSQISGTTGGVGTYYVSIPEQTVASTTVSGTYGILTIGTATGTFLVGDTLSATGAVVAGTKITANIAGSGGTGGTMVVDNNTVVSSQTIYAQSNVETKWYATSAALAGGMVKISSQPPG